MKKNVLYYGKDEAPPELVPLRAGALTLSFEAGDLRYIRYGDVEILRRVYVAVRDRNWGTVPPELSGLRIQAGNDGFQIGYEVENRQGEIDFFWRGTITGTADGTVSFRMEGLARSTFLRNRIGFCLLHPMRECAGQPCRVEKVDGRIVESVFPRYISPHQPFKQIRAISHRVIEDLEVEVRFEGDVFEMEDQRNWTDASFKTYCTPLELPFPVEVKAGTKTVQSVTLSLKGRGAAGRGGARTGLRAGLETRLTLSVGGAGIGKLPRLGLETASHDRSLSEREIERLKALKLTHLRAELGLDRPDWEARLQQAGREAEALGVELELAIFISAKTDKEAERELRSLRSVLDSKEFPVCTWLIFHRDEKSTDGRWVELARRLLQDYCREALIGSGTNAYFTELNRGRPPLAALDLICYSINPQVHAFDNRSLIETLEAQGATVESARQFSGGRPVAVSPITLRPRYNPNATGPEPEVGAEELPPQVDPRQMSLFGASWTLGSLKYLGQSTAYSATYYETSGWRGVMELDSGSEKPALFPSMPGSVFPLYHVLADVGEWKDAELLVTESSNLPEIEALALRRGSAKRIILTNLSEGPRTVAVSGIGGPAAVRFLDERTVEQAMSDAEHWRSAPRDRIEGSGLQLSLELLPFAVACIDTE